MRSKAQFKTHPIHPMMVAFPIAFIYGMAVADVASFGETRLDAALIGGCLSIAAVATGLAAGIPGLIDYLYVVPPRSSGRRRATWHMAVNISALAMIALGWLFRDWETFQPSIIAVGLEISALGLVTWGGWMGGTLVYRNQIGVDHRYAGAGKWREQVIAGDDPAIIEDADKLQTGQMMLVRINGRRVVLGRTNDGLFAVDDRCTHRGGSLAGGVLACEVVCCPWHGSHFHVSNGSVAAGPAKDPITVYRVEESGGKVRIVF